jgi:capsular polysaccharide export protein
MGLFGLVFRTASMCALCQPDDPDRAEGFVQGFFRDDWKLEEHACLYAAALDNKLDGYFAETAFLTSVMNYTDDFTIPLKYRRMYGFLVGDLCFYFDALLPSRLELYLNSGESAPDEPEAARCRAAMRYIVANKLTKYNFPTLHTPALLPAPGRKVLVVDQCCGDASVTRGLAGTHTFAAMLKAAVRENPGATVIVKTHPNTVTGVSAGYYCNLAEGGRIRKLTEAVNPHVLFPYVDKVYVCTSQVGFEALMAGKPVVTFGMPAYAGWGLTDDRAHCPRRTRKLSLEELFYGLYVRFCVYFNPYAPEPCTLEEFMAHLVRLRAEYWDFAARRKP